MKKNVNGIKLARLVNNTIKHYKNAENVCLGKSTITKQRSVIRYVNEVSFSMILRKNVTVQLQNVHRDWSTAKTFWDVSVNKVRTTNTTNKSKFVKNFVMKAKFITALMIHANDN